MKNSKTRLAVLLLFTLCLLTGAYGQLTPSGDSYTNAALPTTNYGAKTLLDVESTQTTYIQFDLSSIPSGYTSADITKATLKLYVNAVTTAGSFNVDYVNGTWSEGTIDASNAPALGNTIAASVPLTTADKNQYILIDITSAVQAWLSGTANDGIALVANSPLNASFDSKENTTTSHPAELDIVFAGGGTLTGITTASGSGLTGGGTSGTLNLSLTNGCATNQVLQWNGTSWVCAAVGTGTVTSVGSGAGLTGGPITGTGTLSIATGGVTNAMLANPYARLNVANTFTGNQTVNGNLTATGVVTGSSFQIGSNLFAFGSYANANAFLGFAGNTTMTGKTNTAVGFQALLANTSGQDNTAIGYDALVRNTMGLSNTAVGVQALVNNTSGSDNTALGNFTLPTNTSGGSNTAVGSFAGDMADGSFLVGSNNTAMGSGAIFSTGTLNNATAIGANSMVAESNALVLGSINGVGFGTSNVSVGIGTTAPAATLDVRDNGFGGNTISATSAAVNNAVYGNNTATSGLANGAAFYTASPQGTAVVGVNTGSGGNDYAGYFQGNVFISGNLAKSTGTFEIDHPLDPANKYLYHSFVESPDMKNIYDGVVTLDARGSAWITLPEYFEALNQDFRYQLTAIGKPGPNLYIAKKIEGNRFKISGGKPNAEVSWQVTGIRHDAYADAHRIEVEVEKPPQEQGRYLHPELFGAPAEEAIGYQAPPVPTKHPTQDETAHVSSLKTPPTSLR